MPNNGVVYLNFWLIFDKNSPKK